MKKTILKSALIFVVCLALLLFAPLINLTTSDEVTIIPNVPANISGEQYTEITETKPEKVTDPTKQVKDANTRATLSAQGIDPDYVELTQDYALSVVKDDGKSSYAITYTDRQSGKKIMEISQLPMVNANGEKLDTAWSTKDGKNFSAGINQFIASVAENKVTVIAINDQPDGRKQGDKLTFQPQLFLNGVEIKPVNTDATMLAVDPTNENYTNNVLVWDYGIAKRYLRLIEGSVLGSWVFTQNPNGSVRIKYNQIGDFNLKLGQFATDNDTEVIPLSAFDIDAFGRPQVYPFTVSDSLSFDSTTADGSVYSYDDIYALAQNGTGAGRVNYGAASVNIFIYNTSCGPSYYVSDGWTYHDTSALPDDCTITAADMYVYIVQDTQTDAAYNDLYIVQGVQATPYTTGNFVDQVPYVTSGGSLVYTSHVLNAYNIVPMNGTGLGWISKTGVTKLCFKTHGNLHAHTPTAADELAFYSMDKGAGYQPKLVVTYTVPSLHSWDYTIIHDMIVGGATPKSQAIHSINGLSILTLENNNGVVSTSLNKNLSINAGSIDISQIGVEPASTANRAGIYALDLSADNCTIGFFTETAVQSAFASAVTNRVPVRWNGATYYLLMEATGFKTPVVNAVEPTIEQGLQVGILFFNTTTNTWKKCTSISPVTWETLSSGGTELDLVFGESVAHGISSGDITNWNNKLSSYTETDPIVKALTGIIVSNGSVISAITDSHSNWDAGYTYRLTSASGTSPLTLTLNTNGLTGSVDLSSKQNASVSLTSLAGLSWTSGSPLVKMTAANTFGLDTNTYMSNALTSAHIFVGNGSAVATDVAAGGDVSLLNTGAFTVTGIQGKSISLATGYLKYTGSAWSFDNSAFMANPMTTLGDIIYENVTPAPARLAGDTSNTRKFLRTLSVAGVAQAPAWDTVASGDLPATLSNTTAITGLNYLTLNAIADASTAGKFFLSSTTTNALKYYDASTGLHQIATLDLSQTFGASSTWNGGLIAGQYGGTGVANTGKTITLNGNLTIPTLATGYLYYSGSAWAFQTPAGGTHNLLDGSTHLDTTAGTVARGDVITGQGSTAKWTKLLKGTANQVLSMDATGTDVLWTTPVGGSNPSWYGKIAGAMASGDPGELLLHMQRAGNIAATPTAISTSVARCAGFMLPDNLEVKAIRWYGVGATTMIYHVAIYRYSDGARLTSDLNFSTNADAWQYLDLVSLGGAVTLSANTLYYIAVSADSTGTTPGICSVGTTIALTTGRLNKAPQSLPGNLNFDAGYIDGYFFQFAVASGALPATAPTLAAQAIWVGGMPAFFLDNSNSSK